MKQGVCLFIIIIVVIGCSPPQNNLEATAVAIANITLTAVAAKPTHISTAQPVVTSTDAATAQIESEAAPATLTSLPTTLPSTTFTVEPTPTDSATPSTAIQTAVPTLDTVQTEIVAATVIPTQAVATSTVEPVLLDAPPAQLSPAQVGPTAPVVYETTLSIPTYGYESGFVPTTEQDAIFPYPRLDFSQVSGLTARTYQAVVLENGYISVTVLPELGGRIYSLRDKATGRELLYQNPVIKPTSWGYREWWLAAGGIEWAFPVEDHGLNEWRPWQYVLGSSGYGTAVTVSDVEDRSGMEVGVTISLDSGHAYVTLQPWARNISGQPQPYQLWLNAMLTLGNNTVSEQTQFIVPGNEVIVHSTGDGGVPGSGGTMNWPYQDGRDMSMYGNWNGYLGFFVPAGHGFSGLYDHSNGQGIVRAHAPNWPSGTKFFGPSTLSPSLWTDDNSNYVELWSGATGSFWHSATIEPEQTVTWTEHWYPINGSGGFNYANRLAALNLIDTGNGAEIGIAVSTYFSGDIILWLGEEAVASWPVQMGPSQAFRVNWQRPEGTSGSLGLRLQADDGSTVAQFGAMP